MLDDQVEVHATFWEHAEQLRRVLIRSSFVILLGMALSFFFYDSIFSYFTSPLQSHQSPLQARPLRRERVFNSGKTSLAYQIPKNATVSASEGSIKNGENSFLLAPQGYIDIDIPQKNALVILSPIEGFTITLKICFWMGLVATSPIWFWIVLHFISPALNRRERKLIFPFIISSFLSIALGMFFAHQMTIPLANQYLQMFNSEIGMNLWRLSDYIDYTLLLLLANGLAFEFFAVGLFLVELKVITAQHLAGKRRHMIVAAFIIGAVLTPPDIFTQVMLAVPLILFYEMIILYAKMREGVMRRGVIVLGRE